MRKLTGCLAGIALACTATAQPADTQATRETVHLYNNLKKLSASQYLVGHQDALAYGVHWKYQPSRSDVKDVTGDYPALYGWELGHLEQGATVNLDSVPFDKMRTYIRKAYAHGSVVTISWHGNNPLTGGSAWDAASGSVAAILPGGPKHTLFLQQLDKVATFLQSLTGKHGEPIPVIFRPFHELSGGWFWWGAKSCTPQEFTALYRFTINYLRQQKRLHHLLICFNTGTEFTTAADYLERYPGDDYVDILSFDTYQRGAPGQDTAFARSLSFHLGLIETIARQHHKLPAIGELGYNQVPDSLWYTHTITPALQGHHFAYLLYWRNAGVKHPENKTEYYIPYKGHPAAADFLRYYYLPATLFAREAAQLHLYQ